jgi:hypothetical protein
VRIAARLACVAVLALPLLLPAQPALADEFGPPSAPPKSTSAPQTGTAKPTPTRTCRMYGSSAGYGLLCADGGATGPTLLELFMRVGVNFLEVDRFCWDDPNLPDGFEPDKPMSGPGQWWLHTCLSFEGAVVRTNARLSYEYRHRENGQTLTPAQQEVVALVTGRGQIPFLKVQTSPISSPRVDQDVAFSMLCDSKVTCTDSASGRRVTTAPLTVGGVTMHAELVHLRVLPEGPSRPEREVNCTGAGLPRTAEQLDGSSEGDPRVCRYRYERSSDGAGAGERGDRYPAVVTAFWQIWYDDGTGPRRLGLPYEKTTVNSIRVTEVQTLVVS